MGCSTLEEVEISDGVESIGRVAFSKCSALSRIEIGREVRSIGASAFAETKIWQDSGDIVYADDWVVGCKNLNIGIDTNGQLLLEEGTAGIAEQVFYSCKEYLLEIIFPDSLKAIGTNAFRECTNLTVVVLGGETESIGEFAFYQCKNLTSVMCGNNVKLISIGQFAFAECPSLSTIELPSTLETIGHYAFYNCQALNDIDLPDGLKSLGTGVFVDSGNHGITRKAGVVLRDNGGVRSHNGHCGNSGGNGRNRQLCILRG